MSEYTSSPRYRRCQAIFDRRYPHFENAGQRYARLVRGAIDAAESATQTATQTAARPALLDVGCGRTSLAADAIRRAPRTLGIDLSASDLAHNTTVGRVFLADASAIPFRDAAFDVLISQWVVEHFEFPARSFAEMARVLRPGGRLVIFTTNANNYIPLAGRLVPERLRSFVLHRLLRRPAHESFPTFYRANTARAIRRAGEAAGLHLEQVEYIGNPFYLAFNVPLFRLAMAYERLTDVQPFRAGKLYLVAVLRRQV